MVPTGNGLPAPVNTAPMDNTWDAPDPPHIRTLLRLLNGLEAGVVGGLAMLLFLIIAAVWRGDVWWAPANLLGTTFYGRRAFHTAPGIATVAGAAFHVMITGIVGALFGLACGGVRERRRLVVLGALAGVFWYYLADAIFWRWVNVLVPAYAPQPSTLIAHAIFGACLGFMGQTPVPQVYKLELPPPLPPIGRPAPLIEPPAALIEPPPLPPSEPGESVEGREPEALPKC